MSEQQTPATDVVAGISIGRIVIYRSKAGDVPAIVAATQASLHEPLPPLDSANHVHLTCFSPDIYAEWNVPWEYDLHGQGVPQLEAPADHPIGAWRWPDHL